MKAVLCPVCGGKGTIPPIGCQSYAYGDICHACGGQGWVCVPDEQEYPNYPIYQPPKTTG